MAAAFALLVVPAARGELLTPVEERADAPPLVANDLSGKSRSLDEFAGKVVLVNFWATWCPPCVKELPLMQTLWEEMKDRDFVLVAVEVGDDRRSVEEFVGSFPVRLDFEILLDTDATAVKRWPVFGLPMTFVIDRAGKLAYQAYGARDWSDPRIVSTLSALINARD